MKQEPNKAEISEEKREKLPMEKKFDQWVYGGISYAAQAVAGSLATYWIKHAGGKLHFDRFAEKVGSGLVSKITSYRGARATEVANGWLTVGALVMVGNLFVLPVKWLEDIKIATVEKWTKEDNQAREAKGEAITPEEKQHQAELLEQLKAAPKQTWWSLGTGRLASLVPVFVGVRVFAGANKWMESSFQGAMKWLANAGGLKKLANSEVYHNASGIAFMDGFYSMLSAGGLYVYSHFIAPPKTSTPQAQPAREIENSNPEMPTYSTPPELAAHDTSAPRAVKKSERFTENLTLARNIDTNHQMAL